MTITKTQTDDGLMIALAGRLDTTTSPKLEAELGSSLSGVKTLVLDFKELDYISSAGLRVVLSAQKTMKKQGRMVIRNVNSSIMEVFDLTGFSGILDIE